jgi:hypothetical protein
MRMEIKLPETIRIHAISMRKIRSSQRRISYSEARRQSEIVTSGGVTSSEPKPKLSFAGVKNGV